MADKKYPDGLARMKIGNWRVLEKGPPDYGRETWVCRCYCGTRNVYRRDTLLRWISSGKPRESCGCMAAEAKRKRRNARREAAVAAGRRST